MSSPSDPPGPGPEPDPTSHALAETDQAPTPAVALLPPPTEHPWTALRRYTPARIALGRIGSSLPTAEVLAFSLAHARARDAVHLPLNVEALATDLEQHGFPTMQVRSSATTRAEYLHRPDLGRRLDPSLQPTLQQANPPAHRLTFVIGDGLSALAPTLHALPLLLELRTRLLIPGNSPWQLDTIVIATQARVALADEIGALRGAEAVVILLGERPGLSAPDSLGIYLTYAPRPGLTDADRNCISNVRAEGLSYAEAANKLHYLLHQASLAGTSGVTLKDASDERPPTHTLR